MRSILLAVVAATLVCACKTPTAMTARATGCSTKDVEIVDSRYKREGSTTAWCARCKGKVYICEYSRELENEGFNSRLPGRILELAVKGP